MRARYALADITRQLGTLDGVTEGLDYLRDMLRLCRSDNMGVRDLIPALMLQLDLDQDCYDFIKWWIKVHDDRHYDWSNTELPYLDVEGANVLENVAFMERDFIPTHYFIAILLLKLKLLTDIINLKLTRKVIASRLPVELWRRAELGAIRSPLSKQWAGRSYHDITAVQYKLERQVRLMAQYVQESNLSFMQMLFNPEDYLGERHSTYMPGSHEEGQLALGYSYAAWWEHVGVLELLDSAKSIAERDLESEIVDKMKSKTFQTQPGSARTKAELLADLSRKRIGRYVDDAVADRLGEVRPSRAEKERRFAAWAKTADEERVLSESEEEEEVSDDSDAEEDDFDD
jgi:hypothetical protein